MKKRTLHVILWFVLCGIMAVTFGNAIALSCKSYEKREFVITDTEIIFSGGFFGGDAHYASLQGEHGFKTYQPVNQVPIDVGTKVGDKLTLWYDAATNEVKPDYMTHQIAGYGIGLACLGMSIFLLPWWKKKKKLAE